MTLQIPSKLCIFPLFICLAILITSQAHFVQETLNINEAKTRETLTKLHFYFHDIPNGKHPTTTVIAGPTAQKTISFGTLLMIDDPLTEGPELTSKQVGSAQGMYGDCSQTESNVLIMSMTFYFTQGKFNQSTISVLGRYRLADKQRELPIVGGTGVFRLARGYALAKTYQFDPNTGVAVSDYNLFVQHY